MASNRADIPRASLGFSYESSRRAARGLRTSPEECQQILGGGLCYRYNVISEATPGRPRGWPRCRLIFKSIVQPGYRLSSASSICKRRLSHRAARVLRGSLRAIGTSGRSNDTAEGARKYSARGRTLILEACPREFRAYGHPAYCLRRDAHPI
jgi:hypothetical protein